MTSGGASHPRLDVGEVLRRPRTGPARRLPQLTLRALRLAWQAAPRDLALTAGLHALAAAALAGQLLVGKLLLAGLVAGGEQATLDALAPELGAMALLTALAAGANLARVERERLLSERVGRYCADQVLDVACDVALIAFEDPAFANRLHRARLNAQIRPAQMTTGLLGVLGGLFAAAGIGAVLLVIEPLLIVVVLLCAAPTVLAAQRASGLLHAFAVRQTENDRRRAYLFAVLARREEAAEVRSFGLARFLRDQHDGLYDERIAELETLTRQRVRLGVAGRLVASVLTSIVLAGLVWLVSEGRLDVAEAGAAAVAMLVLGGRVSALVSGFGSLHETSLFLEDFTSFVDAPPARAGAAAPDAGGRPDAAPPQPFTRIELDDVSFTYPSRDAPSLHGVSLAIGAGEVVALVGANGSGKTTLAKLVAALYTPDQGAVRWDGIDARRLDPARLRAAVAVILQDFVRYHLSVSDNIGLGRHERHADRAAIEAAARATGAHDMLAALADGYETLLGPEFRGGTDLSVGQWQRVALARAFFRDAPLLVLDEPTAALDPYAERALFESVGRLFAGRAVLLISHRFANVRSADRIYVLDAGRVIESGTHAQLIAAGGRYAELFALQASSYLDVDSARRGATP